MKRWVFYFILISSLILSCGRVNKGYDSLEKGLMGIIENKEDSYIRKELENAAKSGNNDVYGLVYTYYGSLGEEFFNKYLKKSNGNAEYYKALIHAESNAPEEEIINLFESSAKQGNVKAYYMLGNIYQDKLEFSKSQEYFEKGKDAGEMYSIYSYNYNKNLFNEYTRIEELNKKLLDNSISKNEKKELGTLVLEKFSNYDKAYEILKEFISESYSPALYAKAKKIESEDKEEEALQMYNELFFKNRYYLAAFEIAYKLVNVSRNYDLAIRVLEDTNSEDSLINGYRGFIYENLGQYDKAEEYYLKAIKENDADIMGYLGRLYEIKKEERKAKDIYTRAYNLGSINSGYKLAILLEEINPGKPNKKIAKTNKEAEKILEKLANSGNENAIVELSLYKKENSDEVRILNLKGAIRFNATAIYNLGVYYYNKKNNNYAKLYLRTAQEYGYKLDKEFEDYINS